MTPDQAHHQLVTELVGTGELSDDWRTAFEQVPRHWFIPGQVWRINHEPGPAQGRLFPLRREDDPDTWLELAYANDYAVTQVDDGQPAPEGGWEVTSSASAPSVVAHMLAALDVRPGMRVLEIGTGTGYNAALLAHRLGAHNVSSVEIDPTIADQAHAALRRAGFGEVDVITGDGELGHPAAAPYDRVIATVGVSEIPAAWVAQLAPGGRLVAPVTNSFQPPGLAVLDAHGDGTATGRFGAPLLFMGMRAHRVPRVDPSDIVGKTEATSDTELHPRVWAWDRDAATAIGQRIGDGVRTRWQAKGDGRGTLWLLDGATRSWAAVAVGAGPPYKTFEGGGRRLFHEIQLAYRAWVEQGSPAVADWQIAVGPHGQSIALHPTTARMTA